MFVSGYLYLSLYMLYAYNYLRGTQCPQRRPPWLLWLLLNMMFHKVRQLLEQRWFDKHHDVLLSLTTWSRSMATPNPGFEKTSDEGFCQKTVEDSQKDAQLRHSWMPSMPAFTFCKWINYRPQQLCFFSGRAAQRSFATSEDVQQARQQSWHWPGHE